MRALSSGPGSTPSGRRTVPMATTWLTTPTPSACRRNACATAPSATRAAVSRALARSSTGRASSKPYFCMPARSACPGRGRVSGALRACPASTSASTGSAAMTVDHFGHSVLPTWIGDRAALGAPVPDPAGDGDLVLLEAHPRAAAVAEPATGQLQVDVGGLHLAPRPAAPPASAVSC